MRPITKPGSALLAATLLVTLLAGAAATLVSRMEALRLSVSDHQRLLRARLNAQSLVDAAIVRLDRGDSSVARDGRALSVSDLGPRGTFRVQAAAGLVDLNASASDRLAALIQTLGAPRERAEAIADAIADWRDEDNLRRPHGAERDEYDAQDRSAPANAHFRTEEQVALVLGVSTEIAACLAPVVTVFSGSDYVDFASAPPLVRAVVAGGLSPAAIPDMTAPLGQVMIISGEAPLSDRAAIRLTRWVRLTGDMRHPFLVHRTRTDFTALDRAQEYVCAKAFAPEGAP